jgi:hypothetical protein
MHMLTTFLFHTLVWINVVQGSKHLKTGHPQYIIIDLPPPCICVFTTF